MGWVVKKHRGLTVSYNFDNLRGYKKAWESYFGPEQGVRKAAAFVQRKAIQRMREVYFATKSNYNYGATSGTERKYLSQRGRLEKALFNADVNQVKLGKYSYQISIVNDLDVLIKDIPYLKWQEEGVRSNVDKQPFIKIYNTRRKRMGLWSVKKSETRNFPRKRVKILNVTHPALKARRFIRSANLFLRQNAATLFRQHLRKNLAKRFK